MAIKNGKPHAFWGGPTGGTEGGCAKGLRGGLRTSGQLGSALESSAPRDLINILPPMDGAGAKAFGKRNKLRLVGDTQL